MTKNKKLRITLIKSLIGRLPSHITIVKCLGLNKTNSSVIQENCASIYGMIKKVNYLLKVEEVE